MNGNEQKAVRETLAGEFKQRLSSAALKTEPQTGKSVGACNYLRHVPCISAYSAFPSVSLVLTSPSAAISLAVIVILFR